MQDPKGCSLRPEGVGFLEGQLALFPPVRGSGERCELPTGVLGKTPSFGNCL